MALSKEPTMLRAIIMDHYENPTHKKINDIKVDEYKHYHNKSESCIDDLTVYLKSEKDVIVDVRFDGIGCAISTSSTDIMADLITGKTINEAKSIINNYIKMILGEPYDETNLEELIAFYQINKQANRIKCAKIGTSALAEILDGKTNEN